MKKFINRQFIRSISIADDHVWADYLDQHGITLEEVSPALRSDWDDKACLASVANIHRVLLRRTPVTTVPTGYLPLI
mgnify:FL=1